MSVQAKAFGTADCPKCATRFDVISGQIKDQPESHQSARKALTPADVLFRFILWVLGLSVALGLFNALFSK